MSLKIITRNGGADRLAWRKGSGSTVEIFDIEVNSPRRLGTGTSMLEELLHTVSPEIRLVWAITRTSNRIAQEFYESQGFRVVGVLREFYQDEHPSCVDAIMYGRDMPREEEE